MTRGKWRMRHSILSTSILLAAAGMSHPQFFLSAETGGGSGGSAKPKTIPELMQRITTLETEQTIHTQRTTALETERDTLTQRATAAESEVTTLKTEKTTLTQRAEKAEGEVVTLKAAKQTTTQAAVEQAAAMGVQAVAKPGEVVQTQQADPAELWVQYSKSSSTVQAQMRATHGDKLDAAAEAFDKRGKA